MGRAIAKAIVSAEKAPLCVAYGNKRASPLARSFLDRILQPDPKLRPSALNALNEPWIHRTFPKIVLPPMVKKSLCSLMHRNYFKTVALIVIAHTIDRSNLKQAFELYERIDTDGNGNISRKEWRNILSSNGLPEDIAERSFDLIDFDGSGSIRLSEFVAATIDESKLLRSHMIEAAFEIIDRYVFELVYYSTNHENFFSLSLSSLLPFFTFLLSSISISQIIIIIGKREVTSHRKMLIFCWDIGMITSKKMGRRKM